MLCTSSSTGSSLIVVLYANDVFHWLHPPITFAHDIHCPVSANALCPSSTSVVWFVASLSACWWAPTLPLPHHLGVFWLIVVYQLLGSPHKQFPSFPAMTSLPPSPPDSKPSRPSKFSAQFVTGRNPAVPSTESFLSGDRLVKSIALALKNLLSPASSVEPGCLSATAAPCADMLCVSLCFGLSLCAGHHSQEEVTAGQILVSCFDCRDSPDSCKKLQYRVCVQLPHALNLPDYSLLLSSDSTTDLGSLAIDTQTAINGVVDWAVRHDVFYVCNIRSMWTSPMCPLSVPPRSL